MKRIFATIAIGLGTSIVLAQAPGTVNIRGKVSNVSGAGFTLTSDSGESFPVKQKQGFKVYDRVPTDLSHVKDTSFIGVTTVKQPDGKERATEIHIFPEELRGAGEGSRMMNPASGPSGNRMTNGAVSQNRMTNGAVTQSRMTNGAVSQNRMTNGSVAKAAGGTMKVKFAGGEQDVMVPADVKVTEIKQINHKMAAGDYVVVTGGKTANGTVEADRATLTTRP